MTLRFDLAFELITWRPIYILWCNRVETSVLFFPWAFLSHLKRHSAFLPRELFLLTPERFSVTQSATKLFSPGVFFYLFRSVPQSPKAPQSFFFPGSFSHLPRSVSLSPKAPQGFSPPGVFLTYPSHPKRHRAFLPWEIFSLTPERYSITQSATELFSPGSFSHLPRSATEPSFINILPLASSARNAHPPCLPTCLAAFDLRSLPSRVQQVGRSSGGYLTGVGPEKDTRG